MVRIEIKISKDMTRFLHDEKNDTGNTINSIMNRIVGDFIFNNLDLLGGRSD